MYFVDYDDYKFIYLVVFNKKTRIKKLIKKKKISKKNNNKACRFVKYLS